MEVAIKCGIEPAFPEPAFGVPEAPAAPPVDPAAPAADPEAPPVDPVPPPFAAPVVEPPISSNVPVMVTVCPT